MANRRHNPKLAKSLRCYTLSEAAELYRVHRGTVRHWLREGLTPIDTGKPILIHGSALNQFHKSRRVSAKQVCGPCEVYCLSCRVPRRPASDMADYTPLTPATGTITAICPECDRLMTQRVNPERLRRFLAELEVTIRPVPGPI